MYSCLGRKDEDGPDFWSISKYICKNTIHFFIKTLHLGIHYVYDLSRTRYDSIL